MDQTQNPIQSGVEIVNRKILYAQAVFGEEEKQAVLKSLENRWLAHGPLVKQFGEEIAKLFGKKYGLPVNSGSSANLVALAALKLPEGSQVITPACTFATTVSTILLNRLEPVFIDSVIGRYTIDEDLVEKAITERTRAILVPQLIGGVCDMVKLKKLCDKYNLYLIDDSCDTLAPKLHDQTVASYANLTTTSFYGSHIITAMGIGGMVLTDSEEVFQKMLTLINWGRLGDDKEAFENRFNYQIDDIPYDGKFLYGELGFNLKMNEASAAFGLVQLKRFPEFTEIRRRNFARLLDFFASENDKFHLPYLLDGAETTWLAFPLTIKKEAGFSRYDLLKHLEGKGIQTRVLFSGNITRHPLYRERFLSQVGELKNADEIMASGFLIGCHQGMDENQVDYIIESFKEFLK